MAKNIKYLKNVSIFNSPAKILVNPVNKVGVMGAGLALQFKIKYPEMVQSYCAHNWNAEPLHIYRSKSGITVVNFPTKNHWRNKSELSLIEKGLDSFCKKQWSEPIAFPKLGCGYGGLDWECKVNPLMVKYLQELNVLIFIHT